MSQFPRLWLVLTLLVFANSETQYIGRRLCRQTVRQTYRRPGCAFKEVPYEAHSFWLGKHTKYHIQLVCGLDDRLSVVDYKYKLRIFCCRGFEGSVGNCQPVCSAGCPANSSCVAPNRCRCNEGYAGADCQSVP